MFQHPEIKIKQIRELKNLTQEHISNELGLSVRAYSKIESGETQLTINRLKQISAILEIDPIEILGFNVKNIFNINNSEGNSNYINYSDKLIEQYEETIESLKEQISLLKLLMNK
ncbi:helix-turn-helix protein [Flavobacterium aquicola]|uniref:Helix-turn-helix protein n=2 Tax=Flavobacterium aquicola TaxID=1682742 RepID=A0A3E0E3P2_9FLAO|nr:helix-turn-helix protein [Flavobacterium aquicola]